MFVDISEQGVDGPQVGVPEQNVAGCVKEQEDGVAVNVTRAGGKTRLWRTGRRVSCGRKEHREG